MTIEWLLTFTSTLFIVLFYIFIIRSLLAANSNLFLIGSCFGILFFYVTPLIILSITGRFEKGIFLSVVDLKDIDITEDIVPVLIMHGLLVILGVTIYLIGIFSRNANAYGNAIQRNNIIDIKKDKKRLIKLIIILGGFYVLFVARDLVSNNIFSGDAHWYESRHDSMSVENGSIINVIFTYLRNNSRLVFFAALIYGWYQKVYKNDYIFLVCIFSFDRSRYLCQWQSFYTCCNWHFNSIYFDSEEKVYFHNSLLFLSLSYCLVRNSIYECPGRDVLSSVNLRRTYYII
ncbi:Uncharacterised protein [Klebsiella variicola]|nr:Uncharacterised protein [Klebsiella variicola]